MLGYKFCSVLQVNRGRSTLGDALGILFQSIPIASDAETFRLFALSIRMTHKPQYVVIAEGIITGSAHAMIIYGQVGNQLFVCDPNYPGDQDRRIVKNFFFFDPYYSGANASKLGMAYSHIFYAGVGSLIDWNPSNRAGRKWRAKPSATISSPPTRLSH